MTYKAKALMLCVLILLISGCAVRPVNECLIFAPIYLEPEDVTAVSDPLARQLLEHNETGAAVCGW